MSLSLNDITLVLLLGITKALFVFFIAALLEDRYLMPDSRMFSLSIVIRFYVFEDP